MFLKLAHYLMHPSNFIRALMNKIYALKLKTHPRVDVRGPVLLKKKPCIDIRRWSKLVIGSNVTLNSDNKGHHINMFSAAKLFADRKDALIAIGNNTRINETCIHAYKSITIGNNCLIASTCQIFDGNAHDLSFPHVENRIYTTGPSSPSYRG